MKTFIWSDLHLGHANIIKYAERPFKDVHEMDKTLIKNWRETVGSKDKIINLGDVYYNKSMEQITKIIKNCPGYKILIKGNHDKRSTGFYRSIGFHEVYRYPIIYDKYWILSHNNVYINDSMPYANIHGHYHQVSFNNPKLINVSVELTDYKPVLLEDIKNKVLEQTNNFK